MNSFIFKNNLFLGEEGQPLEAQLRGEGERSGNQDVFWTQGTEILEILTVLTQDYILEYRLSKKF